MMSDPRLLISLVCLVQMYSNQNASKPVIKWVRQLDLYNYKDFGPVEAAPEVYVIQAEMVTDLLPGKRIGNQHNGYVSYGGRELAVSSFKFLIITPLDRETPGHIWLPSSNGEVPKNAVPGGESRRRQKDRTILRETLYIARKLFGEEMSVGKVQPSDGCAYFPWNNAEYKVYDYEILCTTTLSTS